MNPVLEFIIRARDEATAVIAKVKSAVSGSSGPASASVPAGDAQKSADGFKTQARSADQAATSVRRLREETAAATSAPIVKSGLGNWLEGLVQQAHHAERALMRVMHVGSFIAGAAMLGVEIGKKLVSWYDENFTDIGRKAAKWPALEEHEKALQAFIQKNRELQDIKLQNLRDEYESVAKSINNATEAADRLAKAQGKVDSAEKDLQISGLKLAMEKAVTAAGTDPLAQKRAAQPYVEEIRRRQTEKRQQDAAIEVASAERAAQDAPMRLANAQDTAQKVDNHLAELQRDREGIKQKLAATKDERAKNEALLKQWKSGEYGEDTKGSIRYLQNEIQKQKTLEQNLSGAEESILDQIYRKGGASDQKLAADKDLHDAQVAAFEAPKNLSAARMRQKEVDTQSDIDTQKNLQERAAIDREAEQRQNERIIANAKQGKEGAKKTMDDAARIQEETIREVARKNEENLADAITAVRDRMQSWAQKLAASNTFLAEWKGGRGTMGMVAKMQADRKREKAEWAIEDKAQRRQEELEDRLSRGTHLSAADREFLRDRRKVADEARRQKVMQDLAKERERVEARKLKDLQEQQRALTERAAIAIEQVRRDLQANLRTVE